jgi:adenosylcobinamide kinase / adenosylcobinamide-phosphate guanylyltransferase
MVEIARSELILGGQKSGKSSRAESLAGQWLRQSPAHRALLLATALPGDAEMRERIARHQRERAERVPGLSTLEVSGDLGGALSRATRPDTLLVVDCLTLWLTNALMPLQGEGLAGEILREREDLLCEAVARSKGPVVLVSNEIGFGVIPMGVEVRAFVDALGRLNQRMAGVCVRVTLMAAGLPLSLKGAV